LATELPHVALTTFYPYYINTGLFEGFKPIVGMIIPTLDANYVVETMYSKIMSEQKEVYIENVIFWLKTIVLILPLKLRHFMQ
jgi:all-trans-retinol dehydrogenase (NAD+)